MEGIATTLTTWNAGVTRLTAPPRGTTSRLARGATIGRPGDSDQQRRVLDVTLALLAKDAPLELVSLDERAE